MSIKTINGILKPDSDKTGEEFNQQIKTAVDNAESVDTANKYVGLVFNLKDNKIDFVPSTSIEDTFSISTTTIVGGASGTSTNVDLSYIRTDPTPVDVGGVSKGETFDGTITDALDKILYPYVQPSFTSFYLSNQVSSLEVGDKIVGGERTFVWTTATSDNIAVNSIKITSGSTELANSLPDTGSATINIGDDIVKTTNTNHYFYIYATDVKGSTISRIFGIYWKWRVYYGSSPNTILEESDVKSLSSSFLTNSKYNTYNTPANDYKWVCYPKVFGTASKFTDVDSGFTVAMEAPLEVSITNSFGVTTDYYCYRSTNSMAGSIRIKIG